jgi:hypothetical protein
MEDHSRGPSLRELLSGISADAQLLGAQTVTLARLEMRTALSSLAGSVIAAVASSLVAAAGLAVLVSAVVLILIALGVPAWGSAVIVGFVLTAAGTVSATYFVGRIRRTEFALKETRESLRETLEWLKLQTGS